MLISMVAGLIAGVSQSHNGKGIVRNTIDIDAHAKMWTSNTGLLRLLSFFCVWVRSLMPLFGFCNQINYVNNKYIIHYYTYNNVCVINV